MHRADVTRFDAIRPSSMRRVHGANTRGQLHASRRAAPRPRYVVSLVRDERRRSARDVRATDRESISVFANAHPAGIVRFACTVERVASNRSARASLQRPES